MKGSCKGLRGKSNEAQREKKKSATTNNGSHLEVALANKLSSGGHMPFPDLYLNGKYVRSSRYINNSLTEEACAKFKLDCVDIDIVQADLSSLHLGIVSPTTYGLVYYLPASLNLLFPIFASVGLRLVNSGNSRIDVETFRYMGGAYQLQEQYKFSLSGEIGCTATANLGFFLLKELEGSVTRRLGVLFVLDKKEVRKVIEQDLPVADDSINQFCRERGFELIATANTISDCDQFPECQNQQGQKCVPTRPECRRKA